MDGDLAAAGQKPQLSPPPPTEPARPRVYDILIESRFPHVPKAVSASESFAGKTLYKKKVCFRGEITGNGMAHTILYFLGGPRRGDRKKYFSVFVANTFSIFGPKTFAYTKVPQNIANGAGF